jgi:hypothetical protein
MTKGNEQLQTKEIMSYSALLVVISSDNLGAEAHVAE